jgi:hypothetical protein
MKEAIFACVSIAIALSWIARASQTAVASGDHLGAKK